MHSSRRSHDRKTPDPIANSLYLSGDRSPPKDNPERAHHLYFIWGLLLGGEYGVWHIIPYVCRFFIPLLLLGPVFFHYHAGAGDIKLISLILAWEGILEGAELLFPGMLLSLPDQRSFPWETAEPKIHPGKDDSPYGCSHFPRCNSGADHKSNGGNASNFPITPGGQIKNRFHPGLRVRRKRST